VECGSLTIGTSGAEQASEERGRGTGDDRRGDERADANTRRQLGEGDDLEHQEEDQAHRAKGADAAVAHDGKPVLGVAADEPVETVGQAVEVQAAREQLPGGHCQ
jgi:hypothetical protein